MTETFRAVEPLRMGGITLAKCDNDLVVIPDYYVFNVAEARALHRWLTCSIDGCDNRHMARSFCESHYRRWKRNGDPIKMSLVRVAKLQAAIKARCIVAENGCWGWVGKIDPHGYGRIGGYPAHRRAYQRFVGPIPKGLSLDHLCRNIRCVNPEHLEPVPIAVNILRGESLPAKNARKTHCIHGHAFAGDNLLIKPNGHRECKACQKARNDSRYK